MTTNLTLEQKEDLQFWFYNKIFADGRTPVEALAFAAAEAGIDEDAALSYLVSDARLHQEGSSLSLIEHTEDESKPDGVYVDIEWMVQILRRARLDKEDLYKAVGIIYKIPKASAKEEVEALPLEEGED